MAIKKFLFVNNDGYYEEGYVDGYIDIRDCDTSLAAGDLVMESLTITNGVDKVTGNTETRSVVGWVVDKPTTTTASILFKGVIDGLSGLTKATKVYLSSTGSFTPAMPLDNYLHILGHAIDSDKLDFDPINTKIKRYYVGGES